MNIIEMLSSDLVEAIAEWIDLSDVQAFVLTCRAFYNCRSRHMREHERLIAKYSNYDATSYRKSLQLLDDVYERPFEESKYLKTLSIGPFAPPRPGHDRDVLGEQFPDLTARLQAMQSRHLSRGSLIASPQLHQLLRSGGGESVAALLMECHLPYLSTIILNGGGEESYLLRGTLRLLITKYKGVPRFLQRLSRVVFHRQGYSIGTCLGCVEYLAERPSVKSITISDARSPFHFEQKWRGRYPQYRNISELYIDGGSIAPLDFGLLKMFKNLNVFSFVGRIANELRILYPRLGYFEGYLEEGCPLAKTLLANSGATLHHLTLRSKSREVCYMGRLHGFVALQTLEIDLDILVPEVELESASSIANTLPRTLKGLCLHVFCDTKNKDLIASMLSALAGEKRRKVPLLTEVKVLVQADADIFGGEMKQRMAAIASQYEAEGVKLTAELSCDSFVDAE